MTQSENFPKPSWEERYEAIDSERRAQRLTELSPRQLSHKISQGFLERTNVIDAALVLEAKHQLERYDRLQRLLGLLAPAGTAPRTALEQLHIQSETSDEVSPIVLDLRNMLNQHWGEWTPALREAEGLPPASENIS